MGQMFSRRELVVVLYGQVMVNRISRRIKGQCEFLFLHEYNWVIVHDKVFGVLRVSLCLMSIMW